MSIHNPTTAPPLPGNLTADPNYTDNKDSFTCAACFLEVTLLLMALVVNLWKTQGKSYKIFRKWCIGAFIYLSRKLYHFQTSRAQTVITIHRPNEQNATSTLAFFFLAIYKLNCIKNMQSNFYSALFESLMARLKHHTGVAQSFHPWAVQVWASLYTERQPCIWQENQLYHWLLVILNEQ